MDRPLISCGRGMARSGLRLLPLACLPGATESSPPLDGVEAASCEQELSPAPLSPPPASASILSSRAIRAGGDGAHEISPALKLRLQRSLSFRRRLPSSCIRTLSTPARLILNSNRSFYAYCSLYAPLSLLPTCCLRRPSRRLPAFLCRLRLLHHPDEPPSTF